MVPVSFCCSNSIFQVAVGLRVGIFFLKFCLLKFTDAIFQIDDQQPDPKAFCIALNRGRCRERPI